jgi:hypothetical protein
MSGPVKVFGRLHDDPIHTRRRQAFEKRQWRKSREVGDYGAAGSTGFDRDADADEDGGTSSDAVAVLEPTAGAHNPSLLAQILSK